MRTSLIRFVALALVWLLAASPAGAACWQWSKTAASNATADPSINWAEGMAPSSVNDSARAMMARLAECRDDLSGALTTSGSSTAYTLTTNQGLSDPPADGQQITLRPHVTNGTAPTLTTDSGVTAYPIQSAPGVAVQTGVMLGGAPYRLTFSTANSSWLLQDFYNTTIGAGQIITSMLANGAVTYAKIQNVSAANILLGRKTSGAGSPEEIGLGSGLALSGGNLVVTSGASAGVVGLTAKNNAVSPNNKIDVAWKEITLSNNSGLTVNFQAGSDSPDSTTTGPSGCDTGTRLSSREYYIWVVSDGAVAKAVFSLSSTKATVLSNLAGSGFGTYTYAYRVGATFTDGSSNFLRVSQKGRIATLTSASVSIGSGVGTFSFSGKVPATAVGAQILISWQNASRFTATVDGIEIANFGAGAGASSGAFDGSASYWVYYSTASIAMTGSGSAVDLKGWEDNL